MEAQQEQHPVEIPLENEVDAKETSSKNSKQCLFLYGGIILFVLAIAGAGLYGVVTSEVERRENMAQKPRWRFEHCGEGPLEVDPTAFSAEPYGSIEELKSDVEAMVRCMANGVINRYANDLLRSFQKHRYHDDMFQENDDRYWAFDDDYSDDDMYRVHRLPYSSVGSVGNEETAMDADSKSTLEGIDSFGAYQQEAGPVRGDKVVTNGEYIFVAHNDQILIWDPEGNQTESMHGTPDTDDWFSFPISDTNDNWASIKFADDDDDDAADDNIVALLLNSDGSKLVAITSTVDLKGFTKSSRILKNPERTKVTVYDIDGNSLSILSESTFDGQHMDSFMIDDNAHIVTTNQIDTHLYLEDPLNYDIGWRFYHATRPDRYVEEASEVAEETIPDLVDKITGLLWRGDEIPTPPLISFDHAWGVEAHLVELISFDCGSIDDQSSTLNASKTSVLRQRRPGYVYAHDEWIWVADAPWLHSYRANESSRLLSGFRLHEASSTFTAFGTLSGSVLNPFSIDLVKDQDSSKEYIRVVTLFKDSWFNNINTTVFEIPTSENKINELVTVGSIEVGNPCEEPWMFTCKPEITAVRFVDHLCYIVTDETGNPLYVVDLLDPAEPKVIGKLETYLTILWIQPMKEDNSGLITVGKEISPDLYDDFGLQISTFDVSEPSVPKVANRLFLEEGLRTSWESRAFRYVQDGNLGRLIIPLKSSEFDWNTGSEIAKFEGFTVFEVDMSNEDYMISHLFDINHADPCEPREANWVPKRSVIFDGNLMTMRGQQVQSHDFFTGEILWALYLEGNKCKCLVVGGDDCS